MIPTGQDSLHTRSTLEVGGKSYAYYSLAKAAETARRHLAPALLDEGAAREPAALRGRRDRHARRPPGDGRLAEGAEIAREIQYRPARVLMQDFTGVPAVVDLAAMRDAMKQLGGDPQKINPLVPVHLVIDHSVMVDEFGTPKAFEKNVELEYQRNGERYEFLKWGSAGVRQFPGRAAGHRHLPPGEPRIYRAMRVDRRGPDGRDGRLPRHAGRHRQPHDDGQRPRRARLGRRRDRGRSGDARPAGLDADPGSRRLPPRRRAQGRHYRDRPRADRHPDAARQRASSAASSNSTARASTA